MTEQQIEMIVAGLKTAIDQNPYGKITLELRGPERPVDMIVESRTRFPTPEELPVTSSKMRVIKKDR